MAIVRYKPDPANPPKLTPEQEAHHAAMRDDEIEANALSDPDNPPMTDEELAGAFRPADLRQIRERLALSQGAFADRFGISVRTLQEWEQGRRVPDQVARVYLRVISREPETVARAVAA